MAICDDDNHITDQIKKCIIDYKKDVCTIEIYHWGEELLKEKRHFHVIFLDIDMKGINGIETAKRIRSYDKDVKIIYITNYTDYMNLAFEVHAFAYINKPVHKEEIFRQVDEVMEYSLKQKDKAEFIEFITKEGILRLNPKDIYYFEYIDRKIKIKTLDHVFTIKDKITTIEKNMNKYGFLMPHKSFTVNLFYVKSIKGYNITMLDGSIVPLSQKKSTRFRDQFNSYLEKHLS